MDFVRVLLRYGRFSGDITMGLRFNPLVIFTFSTVLYTIIEYMYNYSQHTASATPNLRKHTYDEPLVKVLYIPLIAVRLGN